MTQLEKLVSRIMSLEPSSLYQIMVYIDQNGEIGFWIVDKTDSKLEGLKPINEKKVVV